VLGSGTFYFQEFAYEHIACTREKAKTYTKKSAG
jgi:hypothetical protein